MSRLLVASKQHAGIHRAVSSAGQSVKDSAAASWRQAGKRHAPVAEGESIALRIEALTSRGQGLGRVGALRWVVMVFGALPQELVQVSIVRSFKTYSEGRLDAILEPSSDRVTPRCSIFEQCSGCQYQHLAYDSQLTWKRQHVHDALAKIAKLAVSEQTLKPVVPSPLQYHYRTKLTPHFQAEAPQRGASLRRESSNSIGFLAESWGEHRDKTGRRWKEVVDMKSCPIATESINAMLTTAREQAREIAVGGALLLRHTTHDGVVTDGQKIVTEEVPGVGAFMFRAGGFFQNNSAILPQLVQHVVEAAASAFPETSSTRPSQQLQILIDVYCGIGLFAIAASAMFGRVFGIEVDASAVALGRKNAEAHGVANIEFLAAAAEDGLAQVRRQVSDSSSLVVIVDPPRQGLVKEVRSALTALQPARIVYVSCDCSTQARDLQDFLSAGYVLDSVTPFDLFPQTRHLEVVAVLERRCTQANT